MKKILKKLLMNLSRGFAPMFDYKGIKIIYYHNVVLNNGHSYEKINIRKFEWQMKYLITKGYKTVTFDDLEKFNSCNLLNEENLVLITFDDGYRNNYDIVFPFMKNYNLKFNIFLEIGAINNVKNYLTWDMIIEMKKSGLVGFGTHTFSHIDARFINSFNFEKEIVEANKLLFEKTGIVAKDFCFPYGAYNKSIITLLDEQRIYKRLYTSDGPWCKKEKFSTIYGRIGIEDEDDEKIFISKIEGRYNLYFYILRKIRSISREVSKNEIHRKH